MDGSDDKGSTNYLWPAAIVLLLAGCPLPAVALGAAQAAAPAARGTGAACGVIGGYLRRRAEARAKRLKLAEACRLAKEAERAQRERAAADRAAEEAAEAERPSREQLMALAREEYDELARAAALLPDPDERDSMIERAARRLTKRYREIYAE